MYVCMHVYMYVCMYVVCIYACIYVCMYMCIYVYMYACVCVHDCVRVCVCVCGGALPTTNVLAPPFLCWIYERDCGKIAETVYEFVEVSGYNGIWHMRLQRIGRAH